MNLKRDGCLMNTKRQNVVLGSEVTSSGSLERGISVSNRFRKKTPDRELHSTCNWGGTISIVEGVSLLGSGTMRQPGLGWSDFSTPEHLR